MFETPENNDLSENAEESSNKVKIKIKRKRQQPERKGSPNKIIKFEENESTSVNDVTNSAENNLDTKKGKIVGDSRTSQRKRSRALKNEVLEGNKKAIQLIKNQIALLESKGPETITAKRKLKRLKNFLKLCNNKNENVTEDYENVSSSNPEVNDNVQVASENKTKKKQPGKKDNKPSKSRYVVFVGNLSYLASEEDLSDHFSQVGQVVSVRISKDKVTNKPKGFAHVELKDSATYEKALSLHHSFLNKRRINVLYSDAANKEKSKTEHKFKNENKSKKGTKAFKIKSLRDNGKLLGNKKANQKRAARRAKKRFFEKKAQLNDE